MIHALVTLQMLAQRAGERLHDEQDGATAVEYGLLVALIAAVIIAVVTLLGQQLVIAFDRVCDSVSTAVGGTGCP